MFLTFTLSNSMVIPGPCSWSPAWSTRVLQVQLELCGAPDAVWHCCDGMISTLEQMVLQILSYADRNPEHPTGEPAIPTARWD